MSTDALVERSPASAARLGIFAFVCAIIGVESSAHGATFVAELTEIVADESGEYASAQFDFGTHFSRIDRLSIQLTPPFSLPLGVRTGHSHYWSCMEVDLFQRGKRIDDLNFEGGHGGAQADLHALRFALIDVVAGVPKTTPFPGGTWTSLSMLPESGWPQFLIAGQGFAKLSVYRNISRQFDAGWKTEETFQAPEALTSVYLIVEGVAVPEPATCSLIGGVIIATTTARRRRVC